MGSVDKDNNRFLIIFVKLQKFAPETTAKFAGVNETCYFGTVEFFYSQMRKSI